MGDCISREPEINFDEPVNFNHFHILRAIGKGAFGKVCIVKKKDTKQMYALKYMNKVQIIRKHAVENVFREIKILRSLEHTFLVNLWFTFQDREDIFIVLDLMLGGDLNYHLEKAGKFSISRVKLYIAEVSLALEYLCSRNIIHRDIKPANMLLDSQGHVHLTDFNVATIVKPSKPIMSVTGTKPYMAPEVVQAPSTGYLYAVDWWSLGVSAYEMLRGHRPFIIEKNMTNTAMYNLLKHTRPSASASWDQNTCDVLKTLLHPDVCRRLQTADKMRSHPFFADLTWEEVEDKTATPPFIPPQNRINCDPTHELEEMIVEPNPLHKKRHRLSKRSFRAEEDAIEVELQRINKHFKEYNRQRYSAASSDDGTTEDSGEVSTGKKTVVVHKTLEHEGESSTQRLITAPHEEEEEEEAMTVGISDGVHNDVGGTDIEKEIKTQEVTVEREEVAQGIQEVTVEREEVTEFGAGEVVKVNGEAEDSAAGGITMETEGKKEDEERKESGDVNMELVSTERERCGQDTRNNEIEIRVSCDPSDSRTSYDPGISCDPSDSIQTVVKVV